MQAQASASSIITRPTSLRTMESGSSQRTWPRDC
jgi:hypothetical protein